VFASDLNPVLIAMHQALKNDAQKLADEVSELLKDQTENRFYEIRKQFNVSKDPARFIYINKLGFNGLYRENKKGECNVPIGRGQKVKFVPGDYIALGTLYRQYDVQFTCCGWSEALKDVQEAAFVYCDPPYVALSATSNFTGYTSTGWGLQDTSDLLARAVCLGRSGAKVLLSNHDVAEVTDALPGFTVERIAVYRGVSASKKARCNANEVLAKSWN
jgi:DNA adenine methylase